MKEYTGNDIEEGMKIWVPASARLEWGDEFSDHLVEIKNASQLAPSVVGSFCVCVDKRDTEFMLSKIKLASRLNRGLGIDLGSIKDGTRIFIGRNGNKDQWSTDVIDTEIELLMMDKLDGEPRYAYRCAERPEKLFDHVRLSALDIAKRLGSKHDAETRITHVPESLVKRTYTTRDLKDGLRVKIGAGSRFWSGSVRGKTIKLVKRPDEHWAYHPEDQPNEMLPPSWGITTSDMVYRLNNDETAMIIEDENVVTTKKLYTESDVREGMRIAIDSDAHSWNKRVRGKTIVITKKDDGWKYHVENDPGVLYPYSISIDTQSIAERLNASGSTVLDDQVFKDANNMMSDGLSKRWPERMGRAIWIDGNQPDRFFVRDAEGSWKTFIELGISLSPDFASGHVYAVIDQRTMPRGSNPEFVYVTMKGDPLHGSGQYCHLRQCNDHRYQLICEDGRALRATDISDEHRIYCFDDVGRKSIHTDAYALGAMRLGTEFLHRFSYKQSDGSWSWFKDQDVIDGMMKERLMSSSQQHEVAEATGKEENMDKGHLNKIMVSAGGIVTVDMIVKTATRKLARALVMAGKPDAAEMLISKEGRSIAKTVVPAALLGWASILADHENPGVAQTAESMLPALQAATASGLASVSSMAIEKWFIDEEDEMDQIKAMIQAARMEEKPVAERTLGVNGQPVKVM